MKIKEFCSLCFLFLVTLVLPAPAQIAANLESENQPAPENQKSADFYFHQGEKLFRSKLYKDAISPLKQALALSPEDYRTYNRLCLVYFNLENYEAAIDACQKNVNLRNSATGFYNLGRAYTAAKKGEEAIEAFKKSIALRPDFADAYFDLATVHIDLKQYNEAELLCGEALRLKPQFAEAYFVSGIARFQLKEYERAIEQFKQAILLKPEIADIHFNLGMAYLALQENKKAVESFEKSYQLKSDVSVIPYFLGIAYYRTKKYEKALKALQEAVELKPDFEKARLALGVTYLTLNQRQEAMKQYRQLNNANSELAAKLFKYIYANKVIDVRGL